MTMQDILKGARPSDIFKRYMQDDEKLSKSDIAEVFYQAFPEVDASVYNVLWNWKTEKSPSRQLDDGQIDKLLLEMLARAGYGSER